MFKVGDIIYDKTYEGTWIYSYIFELTETKYKLIHYYRNGKSTYTAEYRIPDALTYLTDYNLYTSAFRE